MAAHATPAFFQHSTKSHPNRPPQRPTRSPEPPCSWTTSTRTRTACSATIPDLKITSDAAYLVQPKARSRAAAHYHLGWHNSKRTNGPVDVLCKTIKNVVSSAAEAKTESIYMSAKHACPMRTALIELGHPQPIKGTPFETDNSTAQSILTSKM